jgi:tetratricopeptide (TPR) repeat protein
LPEDARTALQGQRTWVLYEQGQVREALDRADDLALLHPGNVFMQTMRSRLHAEAGDPETTRRTALAYQERWRRDHPGQLADTTRTWDLISLRCDLCRARGDHDGAIRHVEQLLHKPAINWEWRADLECQWVELLFLAGRHERCAGVCDSLERLGSEGRFPYWRGRALTDLGRLPEAAACFDRALEFFREADAGHPLVVDATRRRAALPAI